MENPDEVRQRRFWFLLVSTLAACLCFIALHVWLLPNPAVKLPVDLINRLEPGDLIFRIGSGWESSAVRFGQNRDDPFSHVGMLVGSPQHWQVVHAVPAELPGRADVVVRDDLSFFLAPERASGVAIYRVAADPISRSAAVAQALQRVGTPFRIVENDRQGQYCTTLIWHAWRQAGVDLKARFQHFNVPFAAGDYLLPHSLRQAPTLRLVYVSDGR